MQRLESIFKTIAVAEVSLASASQVVVQAYANFTYHSTEFNKIIETLKLQFNELQRREIDIIDRETKAIKTTKDLEEREKRVKQREQQADRRDKELDEKEKRWKQTEQRMQDNSAKLPSMIQLSVSGTRFVIAKEKLLAFKGSLFHDLVGSDHVPLTPNGELFIDRDPALFQHIIRFLLYRDTTPTVTYNERHAIQQEFAYFKIPFQFTDTFLPQVITSNLIKDATAYHIKEFLPRKRFQILYQGTQWNFSRGFFHACCDNKGPTLTIIQSTTGHIFGGYAPLPWDKSDSYITSPETFIFTISNPHSIPPTKYHLKQGDQHAIHCVESMGPAFGYGYDLCLSHSCNTTNDSYTKFPTSFVDTTGKGNATFTGNKNFKVQEYEVFAVI